jgi:hypothetical protein
MSEIKNILLIVKFRECAIAQRVKSKRSQNRRKKNIQEFRKNLLNNFFVLMILISRKLGNILFMLFICCNKK